MPLEIFKRLVNQVSEVEKDDLISLKNDAIEKAKKIKSEFDDHLLNAKEKRLLRQEQELGEKEISLNKLEEELNKIYFDLNRMDLEIRQANKKLSIKIVLVCLMGFLFYYFYQNEDFYLNLLSLRTR